jgi:hypothetical protein
MLTWPLMPWRLIAAGTLLAVASATAWHTSARLVRGEWAAADLARERAATTLHAQEVRRQSMQAEAYEASRQQIRLQLTKATDDLHLALQQPLNCKPGQALADLPVPSAVLDSLRNAGASQPND